MAKHLAITLAIGITVASLAVVGGQEIASLNRSLRESADSASTSREAGAALMARELTRQREERAALISEIALLESQMASIESDHAAELANMRSDFHAAQRQLQGLLSSSTDQLTVLESSVSRIEGAEYAALIGELNANLELHWSSLEQRLTETHGQLEKNRTTLAELDTAVKADRDLDRMWNELMGPIVQLAGTTSVGSGVMLRSAPCEDGWRTLVLTAWHVVRDIHDGADLDTEIPVTIYDQLGAADVLPAFLVAHDPTLDVAVLELDSREPFPNGARLPSAQRLTMTRVFEQVYAVGCPLGNDPVPSRGEVSDTSHDIGGQNYWMINAPTFIGNSGGGIFDAESHELLGIFSKIYNYGSMQQTIIPHMGLVTPMSTIYDWIEREGLVLGPARKPAIAESSETLAEAQAD